MSTVDDIAPKKDRRKLLEEWRKQVRARGTCTSPSNSSFVSFECDGNKFNFKGDSSPANQDAPIPMSPYREEDIGNSTKKSSSSLEASIAVKKFLMRRQKKRIKNFGDDNTSSSSILPHSSFTVTNGAKRRRTKRRSSVVPSNSNVIPSKKQSCHSLKEISKHSVDELDENKGPGLQSRLVTMENRIQELEKEKMALSMSKAPLEARLRQREDQWMKEKAKYEHDIYTLKADSKEVDEKYKNLEMQVETLQEEIVQLRYESRKQKAANTLAREYDELNNPGNQQHDNFNEVCDLQEKLKNAQEEIKSLRLEKVSAESEVHATNLELSATLRDYGNLQSEYNMLIGIKESNSEAEIQLHELTKEHTATLAQLNATTGELASLRSQSKFETELKEKQWEKEKVKILFEMSVLKSRASCSRENNGCSEIDPDIEDEAVLKARIEERDRRILDLETQLLKLEHTRRLMHNRIQELRGNIRVFVRTRPFLPCDDGSKKSSITILPDGVSLSIVDMKANYFEFNFDKVFPLSSGQDSVFDEVSDFVQSALDGYHVCLFSYGQTGSGKTHTMQGSGNGAMRGIIPRAVEQILSQTESMKNQKWNFEMTASFLEIYNEYLRDLLVCMNEEQSSKSCSSTKKLTIRRNSSGKSYVEGLTQITICTDHPERGMEGLKTVMTTASRSRSVASTRMNERSSRSHSVFILQLYGVNRDNGAVVEGTLNLCDLAGSERLSRSDAGSNFKRLKETQAINKSLSCLGDVFNALANGSPHIPFRNSKLTFLLQDCLSGDGKALMFVNLSPTMESSNESLCSLRLAQRVNQVELGKARKNIKYGGKH